MTRGEPVRRGAREGAHEVALEADGISVELGGHAILRGVSFAARAGEIVGIFGPSGAGKSTLFRALAGEEPLASGRVRLAGKDVTAQPLWQRARLGLGYLPQTPSVLVDLTVAENLHVFERLAFRGDERGRGRGRGKDERSGGAAVLARELGLGERGSVKAGALSGGERRRLELTRALFAAPRVLLCDEPFAAVDPIGAEKIAGALAKLASRGAAVLLADHHVEAALRLCDRALLLLDGEVAAEEAAAAFATNALVRKHYAVQSAPDALFPADA